MAAQDKATLKEFFETGDVPTEAQFVDLIDSFPLVGGVARVFASTSSAASATDLQNQQVVITRGHVSPADGGAKIFVYYQTGRSGVTTDGEYVVAASGGDDYLDAVGMYDRRAGQDLLPDDTATIEIDNGKFVNKEITYTGDQTLVISGTTKGELSLLLKSDDGSPRTLTLPGNVLGLGTSIVAADTDGTLIRLYHDGTNFHG